MLAKNLKRQSRRFSTRLKKRRRAKQVLLLIQCELVQKRRERRKRALDTALANKTDKRKQAKRERYRSCSG